MITSGAMLKNSFALANYPPVLVAKAPGKFILAGEYGILRGTPALVAAVNLYTTARLTALSEVGGQVILKLRDLNWQKEYSFRELKNLYVTYCSAPPMTQERKLHDLALFTLGYLLSHWNIVSGSWQLEIATSLPIGAGMGSSAALIVAIMAVLGRYYGLSFDLLTALRWGKEIESFQHGASSGLDIVAALMGGVQLFFRESASSQATLLPLQAIYLVNTGTPATTTGQSIADIAPRLDNASELATLTSLVLAMHQSLQMQDMAGVAEAMRCNHRLLTQWGVVPPRVAKFIEALERLGCSAKISGAGASRGENGGLVLVMGEEHVCKQLTEEYGYNLIAAQISPDGVQLSHD